MNDLFTLLKDYGWLGAILYIVIKDVVPWAQTYFQSDLTHKQQMETSRFKQEATSIERQIQAQEKVAAKLEGIFVEQAKQTQIIASIDSTMRNLLNSQATILERIGRAEEVFTNMGTRRRAVGGHDTAAPG